MNEVVHFEIPADNMARAKKFYASVFGWKLEDVPGMNYTMARTIEVDKKTRMPKRPGAINGGMMKKGGTFKTTTLTIDVGDIDKAVQRIVKAGGKLAKKKQSVMDMGWIAYVKDPEGNLVGLWETAKKA
jgi:predicted enzyme related to lactoylglutathione lyase